MINFLLQPKSQCIMSRCRSSGWCQRCGWEWAAGCCAGYPEDVAKVGRRELQTFFERHYGPQALTIAIVGDVTVEEVRPYMNLAFMAFAATVSRP